MKTESTRERADYLTALEVIALLGVQPQTLYADVSRGWIRSVSSPGIAQRLSVRKDVEKVRTRSLARGGRHALGRRTGH